MMLMNLLLVSLLIKKIYDVNDGCAWKWGARRTGFMYGLYTLFCWVQCLSQIIVNFVFVAY